MGDAQKNNHYYSVEEYEAIVKNSKEGERYEYCDGELIAFTDEYTTDDHNQIIQNTADSLKGHFYPQSCRVYTENVRLIVEEHAQFRLPDVMVTCSDRDKESKDAKRDPVIVVEVLSPSTSFTDLVEKVDAYKRIVSLQAYLIINPAKVWVRLYQRDAQGQWQQETDLESINQTLSIPSLQLSISVAKIYHFVF